MCVPFQNSLELETDEKGHAYKHLGENTAF